MCALVDAQPHAYERTARAIEEWAQLLPEGALQKVQKAAPVLAPNAVLVRETQLRARLLAVEYAVDGWTKVDPTQTPPTTFAASLPVYSAAHESKLLVQSGTFEVAPGVPRTFPPCVRGQQCVAWADYDAFPGLTDKIVMCRAMTPQEWTSFCTNPAFQFATPNECVLCHRSNVSEYVYFRRAAAASMGSASLPAVGVCQKWVNRFNAPNEYDGHHILMPRTPEVIVAPLVEVNRGGLVRAIRNPKNGQWIMDQRALLWHPPPPIEPYLGESMQSFCGGVGGQ